MTDAGAPMGRRPIEEAGVIRKNPARRCYLEASPISHNQLNAPVLPSIRVAADP